MGYLTAANIGGSDYKLAGALYGTCGTAASTAAKVVTCSDFDSLETGVTIHVKFTYSNTASNATLNVNSTGAKNLCSYGTTRVGTTEKTSWKAGAVVSFTYDGTSWVMNDYIADTGVTTDTKNTAGATKLDTTVLYLIGAQDHTANPQTYTKSNVYVDSAGDLCADSFNYVEIGYAASLGGMKFAAGNTPTTSLLVETGDSFVLDDACAKGVDTSIASGSTSTNLPTTAAVRAYVDQVAGAAAAGALVYQGTVGSGGDVTDLPAAHTKGWYYIVKTAGTYAGEKCEEGDMIICKRTDTVASDGDWDVIQANIQTLTTAEIDADWAAA